MLKHLACIMDGNRRWAKQKNWLPWHGHRQGMQAARRVIDFCLAQSIPYLSLYTFSQENFKRPARELHFLFNILIQEMKQTLLEEFKAKGVRVCFVGDRSLFPKQVLPVCEDIEEQTKDLSALRVNLLFCYGGRQEIIHGIKSIIRKVKDGQLADDEISEDLLERHLWTSGIPEPDIIVRTGGVKRLSNFFLFKAAYSEFFFLDCLWPDLMKDHLQKVVQSFYERRRNFGI